MCDKPLASNDSNNLRPLTAEQARSIVNDNLYVYKEIREACANGLRRIERTMTQTEVDTLTNLGYVITRSGSTCSLVNMKNYCIEW
jgi:hypothetical protein